MIVSTRSPAGKSAWLRTVSCVAVLGLLSACGSSGSKVSASQEAAQYAARAHGDYTPPGPPSDPWGPYIKEASKRFDVPDKWIREVMRQESGGKLYHNGTLVTSGAGAMGLMQVMPGTYDELRERYDLGPDPFDPHENILAGTAYLREMYDIYGSPGFLAAYNAGPNRLDDYLSNNRTLPDETRKYVASIGPRLQDSPKRRSPAEQYAMNSLPTNIPKGTRYGRGGVPPVDTASSYAYSQPVSAPVPDPAPVQVAQLSEPAPQQAAYTPPAYTPPAPVQTAYSPAPYTPPSYTPPSYTPEPAPAPMRVERVALVVPPTPPPEIEQVAMYVPPTQARSRFHLIGTAQAAEPIPMRRGAATAGGKWAIQVGAFGSENLAQAALGTAKGHAREPLSSAKTSVSTVRQPKGTLYRARMVGLSKDSAVQACEKLSHGRSNCIVLSPDAQS
jgi:hypothetical protein